MTKYDVLYYYVGGSARGEWREVLCDADEFDTKEAGIRRMGYVTRRGLRSIGKPEGTPDELR